MLNEFKKFIDRGNVIDLAVAVIMGKAFTDIVNSLVDDIIMPIVGVIIGGLNFSGLAITIGSSKIMYGAFIQAVINFLIIAFIVFILVKAVNKASELIIKTPKTQDKDKKELSPEAQLLTEIRDYLKSTK